MRHVPALWEVRKGMTMSALMQSNLIVVATTLGVVTGCVLLHYEALTWLTRVLKRLASPPRHRILLLIFAILCVHILEIWIFGGAYFWLTADPNRGQLVAANPIGFLDCVYFSASCFTTLGIGDVIPVGAVRFLVGTQALSGFVLIAWSASFTFVEMERFWRQ